MKYDKELVEETSSNPERELGAEEAVDSSASAGLFEKDPAKTLKTRYLDAYRAARLTCGFGTLIKVMGIILGVLIFFSSSEIGGSSGAVGGLVVGGAIGLLSFCFGLMVSALGQILKAALDSAVNSSPFLTHAEQATIMSMRFAAGEELSPNDG